MSHGLAGKKNGIRSLSGKYIFTATGDNTTYCKVTHETAIFFTTPIYKTKQLNTLCNLFISIRLFGDVYSNSFQLAFQ